MWVWGWGWGPCKRFAVCGWVQILDCSQQLTECVCLTKWYHFIFLRLSHVWSMLHYITDQWGEFKLNTLLYVFIYFFSTFLLFFIINFLVLSFSFLFFDEVSNFRNRILTNQKHELVVSNCQWNCMDNKCYLQV